MERKFNCICCNKDLEWLKDYNELRSAVCGRLIGGYGSEHDMDIFHIAICDECIDKKKLLKIGRLSFTSTLEEEIGEEFKELP